MIKILITVLLGAVPIAVLTSIFYLLSTNEMLLQGVLLMAAGALTVALCYNLGELIKSLYDDYKWNKGNR